MHYYFRGNRMINYLHLCIYLFFFRKICLHGICKRLVTRFLVICGFHFQKLCTMRYFAINNKTKTDEKKEKQRIAMQNGKHNNEMESTVKLNI